MRLVMPTAFAVLALAGVPALAAEVQVSKEDCKRIVAQTHVPAADVAYQPGVDVHGRKVAGADLPESGNNLKVLPDKIQFDMTYNPTAAMKYGANTQMTTAKIEYDIASNRMTMNGQPIGDSQQRELAEACRKAGFK